METRANFAGRQDSRPAQYTAVVAVAVIAAFLPPFMASSVLIALPAIGREFSLSAADLSWVVISYLLAITVLLVPFGKAGDMYGRSRIFLLGAFVYTAGSLLAGFALSSPALIAFRVVQGIGASMIFGTGTAMLASVVPARRHGSMLGLNVSFTYLGLSLGPFLGGFFTQTMGWRSIFFINVPLGIVLIALVGFILKKETAGERTSGGAFDYIGAVLYGAALVALMYGLSCVPRLSGAALVAAGIAGLALFAVVESRVASPVLSVGIFKRNPVFAFSNLAALLNFSATSGAGFLISLYLQYVKGLPPKNAGLVLIAQPLVMAVVSLFAGKLSDRIEPRAVASFGMGLAALGLFYFSRLSETTPLYHLIAGLMLLGSGIAFFSSPNTSAIMGSVEKTSYGVASSISGTMRLLGQMLSIGIAATGIALYVGNGTITPDRHGAFIAGAKVSFLIFGVLCILGALASLSRGRVRGRREKERPKSGMGERVIIE